MPWCAHHNKISLWVCLYALWSRRTFHKWGHWTFAARLHGRSPYICTLSNGQVERTNNVLCIALTKIVVGSLGVFGNKTQDYSGLPHKLLYLYIGTTPYSLVYGLDAILPTDIECDYISMMGNSLVLWQGRRVGKFGRNKETCYGKTLGSIDPTMLVRHPCGKGCSHVWKGTT